MSSPITGNAPISRLHAALLGDDNRWTEAERLARIRHGRCWFFFHLGTARPEEVADRGAAWTT